MTTIKIKHYNGNVVDTTIHVGAVQHGYRNGFYIVVTHNGNEYMYRLKYIVSVDVIKR